MAYSRINWENTPSTATPRNATNLNKMDAAIEEVDTRLSTVETNTKVSMAKITTNGSANYTSQPKVIGIWVNDFSTGDIVAEASNSRLKITNTEILETGGLLG